MDRHGVTEGSLWWYVCSDSGFHAYKVLSIVNGTLVKITEVYPKSGGDYAAFEYSIENLVNICEMVSEEELGMLVLGRLDD